MIARQTSPSRESLLAFPMHGQRKLLTEGYRTRDGHLIEWFGRLLAAEGPVSVYSRPEPPLLRRIAAVRATHEPAANTVDCGRTFWRLPPLRHRRAWWVTSLPGYRLQADTPTPAVVWNPLVAVSSASDALLAAQRRVAFDLLDNWLIHPAFAQIADLVRSSYAILLARADVVTANSEGTATLARSFGRDDVMLIPNGCDPDRFTTQSLASGAPTVGYIGKIGSRLDFDLIRSTVAKMPHVRFVFAGPTLDRPLPREVVKAPNVDVLGDVPYRRIPDVLATFDVGWVPHSVGHGEVGGDAIKIYEYRATGLPVLTTPIIGTRERWQGSVRVAVAEEHVEELVRLIGGMQRVPREVTPTPPELTWEHKAQRILSALMGPR